MESSLIYIFVILWLSGWLTCFLSIIFVLHKSSKASEHLPKPSRKVYFMDVMMFPWAAWTADRLKGNGLKHHLAATKHAQRCIIAMGYLLALTIGMIAFVGATKGWKLKGGVSAQVEDERRSKRGATREPSRVPPAE